MSDMFHPYPVPSRGCHPFTQLHPFGGGRTTGTGDKVYLEIAYTEFMGARYGMFSQGCLFGRSYCGLQLQATSEASYSTATTSTKPPAGATMSAESVSTADVSGIV